MNMIKQFFNDESGATMVEYAVLVALIAVAVIATVVLVGEALDAKFEEIRACIADGTCPGG
ncbi:MAG: Flp family type IVb pilin [Gammaproteobacteria bacterium]|nr:Flp family type IVb pilin [Gammaproteobacteria bacterium]